MRQTWADCEEVLLLMREIAWCMEWVGDDATAELADMPREICRWRGVWPVESVRSVLALRARQMSARALEISGLVASRAGR